MNIQIRSGGDQFFRKRRFAEQMLSGDGTSSDNNLGHAGYSCKFRNLIRHIIAVYRFDFCSELLCKSHVCPQTFLVFLTHRRKIRGFHK